MTNFRSHFVLLIPFLLSGCASATGAFSPLSPDHPASPQAPQLPIEDPSAFLGLAAAERSSSAGAPAASDPIDPAPAGALVCPMHPEVTSEQPGRCPKCGMNLVPREDAAPDRAEDRHDG